MKRALFSAGKSLALIGILAVSCTKMDTTEAKMNLSPSEQLNATVTVVMPDSARTKAANCFQCHGTNGFAGELKIASMGQTEIINKMNYFKSKAANADIMYYHAQMYDSNEVKAIAYFFSKQQ